jgi:hypothetical protein
MLDRETFDPDVREHALMGRARARMFEEISGGQAWSVDLAQATMRIGPRSYRAQILGTFSRASSTFLWAWANPGAGDWGPSLQAAQNLRESGDPVFATPQIDAADVDPKVLGWVAGELVGEHPLFCGPYDGGYALLLPVPANVDAKLISPAFLSGVMLEAGALGVSARSAVSRFLTRLGFEVGVKSGNVTATRGDATFTVEFDAQGRVGRIDAKLGPTRT